MWIFWLWVQNWSKFGIRLHHIHLHLFLVRASARLNTRSRAPVCLPVPDDLKNEDDLKIEDDLENEDNLKSEVDLKKLTVLVFRLYPASLGDALTSAATRPYFLFNLPFFWYKIF